jgi:hypothetical protein
MARSNLLYGLEKKIGHFTGELIAKEEEVERIEAMIERLPDLRARIDKLKVLIGAVEEVITNDYPDWERATIDPIRPHVHHLPIKIGEASRKAMEVLRDAVEPMVARDVAKLILVREGIDDANLATVDRLSNTVNAAFRKRDGKVVTCTDEWPRKWSVIR